MPLSRLVTNTYFSMIEDVEFNHQLFMQADTSKNPEHLLYMMKEHHDKYRICGFCPLVTFLTALQAMERKVLNYDI